MSDAIWIGRVAKNQLPALPEKTTRVGGNQFRIISTRYPPINFFEKHVPAELMDALWQLEAQTNPRLQQETGDINLVAKSDRVSGGHASIVMASFTHIGHSSRFSDGTFGVYYAARSLETAICETVHHRQIIAQDASLSATEFSMRVWIGKIKKHLHDIRGKSFDRLHDNAPRPQDHKLAQRFGKEARIAESWGLVYRSVRDPGGECIAALRPPCISLPTQGAHLVYSWNGEKITQVYEKSEPMMKFD